MRIQNLVKKITYSMNVYESYIMNNSYLAYYTQMKKKILKDIQFLDVEI